MKTSQSRRISPITVTDERITTRVPHAKRAIIERAAAVYGATLNQFIIQTALDRAGEILEREELLRLSEKDSRTFLAALENPPASTRILMDALKRHDKLIRC